MDDIVRAFESARLPEGGFGHREHLHVAWCYLECMPCEEALARYLTHLRALTVALGVADKLDVELTRRYFAWLAERRGRRQLRRRRVGAQAVAAMSSIGRLAARFGLSRSTLLYYDRIGLLSPSARSSGGYRVYSSQDAERLQAIVGYRETGLGLAEIRALLDGVGSRVSILTRRLAALDEELASLRQQQQVIRRLLRRADLAGTARLDKAGWVAILRATGLDDAAMRRWHIEFERRAPAEHAAFLRSLGMSRAEITRVRRWAR